MASWWAVASESWKVFYRVLVVVEKHKEVCVRSNVHMKSLIKFKHLKRSSAQPYNVILFNMTYHKLLAQVS